METLYRSLPSAEETLLATDSLMSQLDDSTKLIQLSRRVVDIADEHNATVLIAASAAAERLVGAAVAASGGSLGAGYGSASGKSVMLVDVNVASGTQLAESLKRALAAGSPDVCAAALNIVTAAGFSVGDGLSGLFDIATGMNALLPR